MRGQVVCVSEDTRGESATTRPSTGRPMTLFPDDTLPHCPPPPGPGDMALIADPRVDRETRRFGDGRAVPRRRSWAPTAPTNLSGSCPKRPQQRLLVSRHSGGRRVQEVAEFGEHPDWSKVQINGRSPHCDAASTVSPRKPRQPVMSSRRFARACDSRCDGDTGFRPREDAMRHPGHRERASNSLRGLRNRFCPQEGGRGQSSESRKTPF